MIANQTDGGRIKPLGVRSQIEHVLAKAEAYAKLDNVAKQRMAEALMLNFLVQYHAYQDAFIRNDRHALHRYAALAVRRFESQLGVDPRRLVLTNSGFVKKSGRQN